MIPHQSLFSCALSAIFVPACFGIVLFLASDTFRVWRDRTFR